MPLPNELVAEATLCCGHAKCPTVRVYAGGAVGVTDTDPERRIDFTPEQARELLTLLETHLGKAGG
jgi:hypothetical protein